MIRRWEVYAEWQKNSSVAWQTEVVPSGFEILHFLFPIAIEDGIKRDILLGISIFDGTKESNAELRNHSSG